MSRPGYPPQLLTRVMSIANAGLMYQSDPLASRRVARNSASGPSGTCAGSSRYHGPRAVLMRAPGSYSPAGGLLGAASDHGMAHTKHGAGSW